ncbi:hypothetical protein [Marinilactibacillus sp. Marseille-P9653]|uniref:hypothetical protein n=1 Tax=Marinilactibacillus sp. Marseille-P9653 TaxID=2866583 RepID=UPI001CE41589|nr:hypothetical protein [Marinilactibacillus sp. Marseille-P9653]
MINVLVFENNQIQSIFYILEPTMIEQGRAKPGKGKLQKALIKTDKEYQEELKEISEEYFEIDDQSNIVQVG